MLLVGHQTPQEIDPTGDPKDNIIKLSDNFDSLFSMVSEIKDPKNSPVLQSANLLDLEKHRILATNKQARLESVKILSDWIKGKRGEIVVKDDEDGGVLLSVGGDVGGPFTIGEPIVGGNANCVLYEDAANLIAQTVGFEFDGTDRLTIPAGGAFQLGGADFVSAPSTGNIAIGIGADVGTGDYNALIGDDAMGASNNTGDYNFAAGYEALYNNTSGYGNFAAGYRALRACLNGYSNLAVGRQSLLSLTTGWGNVAVGQNTGSGLLSGVGNTAIGLSAMMGMTTQNGSTAIGNAAMTNGNYADVVAIGRLTCRQGGGTKATGIGSQALYTANGATETVGIGYQTLYSDTNGIANTGVGSGALARSVGGDYNTAIGWRAAIGGGGTYTNADYNVCIGMSAGYTLGNSVHRTICIGSYAGYNNTTSDRLIIDNRQRANVATEQSHAIIWGTMAANPESQDLRFNTDDLSIGTDADADVEVTFLANSNNGLLTWMEDEDYFRFSDDILMNSTERIYFNDTNTYIYDDGTDLRLETNGVLRFGTHNAIGAESVTGYITIKDSAGNSRKLAVVS